MFQGVCSCWGILVVVLCISYVSCFILPSSAVQVCDSSEYVGMASSAYMFLTQFALKCSDTCKTKLLMRVFMNDVSIGYGAEVVLASGTERWIL
jgi:hypothetical protein